MENQQVKSQITYGTGYMNTEPVKLGSGEIRPMPTIGQ